MTSKTPSTGPCCKSVCITNFNGLFKIFSANWFNPVLLFGIYRAANTLVQTCGVDHRLALFKTLASFYQESAQAIGYEITLLARPPKRALLEAVNGSSDGECARIKELNDIIGTDELVRVEFTVARAPIYLWTYNNSIGQLSTELLEQKPFQMGYIRGYISVEQHLKQHPNISAIPVNDSHQGLKMLYNGRIDVFAGHAQVITDQLTQLGGLDMPSSVGTLLTYSTMAYLHKRHKHLAVPLAKAMAEISQDPNHPIKDFLWQLNQPYLEADQNAQ